jgi:hypothetical protein
MQVRPHSPEEFEGTRSAMPTPNWPDHSSNANLYQKANEFAYLNKAINPLLLNDEDD